MDHWDAKIVSKMGREGSPRDLLGLKARAGGTVLNQGELCVLNSTKNMNTNVVLIISKGPSDVAIGL